MHLYVLKSVQKKRFSKLKGPVVSYHSEIMKDVISESSKFIADELFPKTIQADHIAYIGYIWS